MNQRTGELIIRDTSEFENVKSYSIEKIENGDRSVVCKLYEASICPEHFPGQTVLDLAILFKAAPAMKEALEEFCRLYSEPNYWKECTPGSAYTKAKLALKLANGEDKEP